MGEDKKIKEESEEESEKSENLEESDQKKTSGSNKKDPARNASQSDADGEVKELKERIEDLENQLMRAVADYRNLEKRFEDEKREYVKFANRDLLIRLIPAFDTLFLA